MHKQGTLNLIYMYDVKFKYVYINLTLLNYIYCIDVSVYA